MCLGSLPLALGAWAAYPLALGAWAAYPLALGAWICKMQSMLSAEGGGVVHAIP